MRKIVLAMALALLLSGLARAEDPSYFDKGSWTLSGYGSYMKNFTGELAKIDSGTVGLGYYFMDNLGLNAELSYYHNDQHGPDADIYAGDLLVRHHLLHSGRFSLFIDGAAGISYANHRTPYYGTYYNYVLEGGVGSTFQLWDNVNLIGGVRYVHFSNAYLEGPRHNPSINGVQGYLGVMIRF